jgi:hypothetical protein
MGGRSATQHPARSSAPTALIAKLFVWLYTNFPDAICLVSGGRTGNALNDFNASKQNSLLSMRARGPFGLDDMGNAAAGAFLLL